MGITMRCRDQADRWNAVQCNPRDKANPDNHDRGEVRDGPVTCKEVKGSDDGDANEKERGVLYYKPER
ncbi:MAG: hypothetical protein WC620_09410 [Methanoregula sp.]